MPCSASTRQAATLTVRMAGCVFSVSFRSSSGPSKMILERSKPRASSASAKVCAAMRKRSARSRPMPTDCEPWPGKRKASLVDISVRILLCHTPPFGSDDFAGGVDPLQGTVVLFCDGLVPALLVVRIFVQLAALAVEADGAALGAHVDL